MGPGGFLPPGGTPPFPLPRPWTLQVSLSPGRAPASGHTDPRPSPGGAPPPQPTPLLSQASSLRSRLQMGLGASWVQTRTLCLLPVPWELSRVPVRQDTCRHRRQLWWDRAPGCVLEAQGGRLCKPLVLLPPAPCGAEVLWGGHGTSSRWQDESRLWPGPPSQGECRAASGPCSLEMKRLSCAGGHLQVSPARRREQDAGGPGLDCPSGPWPSLWQPSWVEAPDPCPGAPWLPCVPEAGVSSAGPSRSFRVLVPWTSVLCPLTGQQPLPAGGTCRPCARDVVLWKELVWLCVPLDPPTQGLARWAKPGHTGQSWAWRVSPTPGGLGTRHGVGAKLTGSRWAAQAHAWGRPAHLAVAASSHQQTAPVSGCSSAWCRFPPRSC